MPRAAHNLTIWMCILFSAIPINLWAPLNFSNLFISREFRRLNSMAILNNICYVFKNKLGYCVLSIPHENSSYFLLRVEKRNVLYNLSYQSQAQLGEKTSNLDYWTPPPSPSFNLYTFHLDSPGVLPPSPEFVALMWRKIWIFYL